MPKQNTNKQLKVRNHKLVKKMKSDKEMYLRFIENHKIEFQEFRQEAQKEIQNLKNLNYTLNYVKETIVFKIYYSVKQFIKRIFN